MIKSPFVATSYHICSVNAINKSKAEQISAKRIAIKSYPKSVKLNTPGRVYMGGNRTESCLLVTMGTNNNTGWAFEL